MKITIFKERIKRDQVFQELAQATLMTWKPKQKGSEPLFCHERPTAGF